MKNMKIILVLAALSATPALASEGGATHLFPAPVANRAKATAPDAVKLEEPKYFAEQSGAANLKWTASETATNYQLQVATDPNFKWLVVNEQNLKETSFQVSGLEAGKHYFWRVLAVNRNNDATWTKSFWAQSMFSAK